MATDSSDPVIDLTPNEEGNFDVRVYLFYLANPEERPEGKRVYVLGMEGLRIPWPLGMGAKEALLTWKEKP